MCARNLESWPVITPYIEVSESNVRMSGYLMLATLFRGAWSRLSYNIVCQAIPIRVMDTSNMLTELVQSCSKLSFKHAGYMPCMGEPETN